MPIGAVILAGGRASRMGGATKSLLAIDGVTLLERQLIALTGAGIVEVALSVGVDPDPALLAAARAHGIPALVDRLPGLGPLAGLDAALAWTGSLALVCLAGDLPRVAHPLIAEIAARLARADAVVPRLASGVEPLVAGYSVRCGDVIAERLADGRLRASELPAALAAAGLRVDWIDERELRGLDAELASFTNWNSPADLG